MDICVCSGSQASYTAHTNNTVRGEVRRTEEAAGEREGRGAHRGQEIRSHKEKEMRTREREEENGGDGGRQGAEESGGKVLSKAEWRTERSGDEEKEEKRLEEKETRRREPIGDEGRRGVEESRVKEGR